MERGRLEKGLVRFPFSDHPFDEHGEEQEIIDIGTEGKVVYVVEYILQRKEKGEKIGADFQAIGHRKNNSSQGRDIKHRS